VTSGTRVATLDVPGTADVAAIDAFDVSISGTGSVATLAFGGVVSIAGGLSFTNLDVGPPAAPVPVQLTVLAGATLALRSTAHPGTTVPAQIQTDATVIVTGAGAALLVVGGERSNDTLEIAGGAALAVRQGGTMHAGVIAAGAPSGAVASLSVTSGASLSAGLLLLGNGGGAVASVQGGAVARLDGLAVGYLGAVPGAAIGTLSVLAGGTVLDTGSAELGWGAGDAGTVLVSGAGASLASAGLYVGDAGAGTLVIGNGASAYTGVVPGDQSETAAFIAARRGASGAVTVDGPGADWTLAGRVEIGPSGGAGTLTVSDGALVRFTGTPESDGAGGFYAAYDFANGGGLVAGAVLDAGASPIDVGNLGTAALAVSNAGTVFAGSLALGLNGGSGRVTVDSASLIDVGTRATAVQGALVIGAAGDVSGAGAIVGAVLNSGTIQAAGGTLMVAGPVAGGGTLTAVAGGTLELMQATGTVLLAGGGTVVYAGTGMLGVVGGPGGGTLDLTADGTRIVLPAAPCFAAGTRIATQGGEAPVESLRAGDLVRLAAGGQARVVWTGRRGLDCRRHKRPWDVMPVRVRAGAVARGVPVRDLILSPDHAVRLAGALIPVRYLLNGATVVQQAVAWVTYCHVELARHDLLLAEGLPAESYLDTGNRAAFAGGVALTLHPNFARDAWAAGGCAPLVRAGPRLAAARRLLARRAAALGYTLSDDPELSVLADGRPVAATTDGGQWRVALPPGTRRVRLVSRAWVPAQCDATATDGRRLGVAVARLWLDRREVSLDSAGLGRGWHAAEPGWRWTDGNAALLLDGVRELAFTLAMTGRYWVGPASYPNSPCRYQPVPAAPAWRPVRNSQKRAPWLSSTR
jgi:T5SS/PEP-CTERM-associated repeat protein